MFKIVQDRTFIRTITVMTPSGNDFAKETLKVTYNYLSTEETKGFDLKSVDGSTAFLRRVVASLDDLSDADGNPLTFNEAVRDVVLAMPNARHAITEGYFIAINKAAEGN